MAFPTPVLCNKEVRHTVPPVAHPLREVRQRRVQRSARAQRHAVEARAEAPQSRNDEQRRRDLAVVVRAAVRSRARGREPGAKNGKPAPPLPVGARLRLQSLLVVPPEGARVNLVPIVYINGVRYPPCLPVRLARAYPPLTDC